jgi:6-phosphogluconolactonase
MINADRLEVYVASCDKNGGIYRIGLSDQGKSRILDITPMDRPMYMVTWGSKMYVLLRAPFESKESALVICDIDNSGRVILSKDMMSTHGEVACHLCVTDENEIYATNYISGSVIKFPDILAIHRGTGVDPVRQSSPHTHFVSASPDGKYILVTDLGLDRIVVYDKNLREVSHLNVPKGHGPRHLDFYRDANDSFVFCANELQSTVSVIKYNDGQMQLLDTVSVLPDTYEGKSTVAAIRVDGNCVYVSNRGHDSISVLEFSDGILTLKNIISTYGNSPRDFIIFKDWLIVTNELSDDVAIISNQTGELVEKITVKSPLCVDCAEKYT